MNAKKSKLLRNKAKEVAFVNDLPEVEYEVVGYNKVYTDLLTGKVKGYRVHTLSLSTCQRSVYVELKKNFKRDNLK